MLRRLFPCRGDYCRVVELLYYLHWNYEHQANQKHASFKSSHFSISLRKKEKLCLRVSLNWDYLSFTPNQTDIRGGAQFSSMHAHRKSSNWLSLYYKFNYLPHHLSLLDNQTQDEKNTLDWLTLFLSLLSLYWLHHSAFHVMRSWVKTLLPKIIQKSLVYFDKMMISGTSHPCKTDEEHFFKHPQ